MYNIIFIFIFVLGKTLGTGNNKPSDKEGSSNPYGTGYNLSGYYLPYPSNPFNVGQGAHSGYTGDYLHSYNSDVNTFHGAGINTHFNQYNQGIPSEQQINTSSSNYLEGLGEMFKNLPPSVIVPPTSSASNNIIQSSLPNLSSNTDYLPTNYQNVDHSVQYPYNSNNIPPPYSNQYSGGYSTSAVQNNDFHRGMSQSEQLNSLPNLDELGEAVNKYIHNNVINENLQGNEFSNPNNQQNNQDEALQNNETLNTQFNDDKLLKENRMYKEKDGKYYRCNICNTKFLFVLKHINSPKHLENIENLKSNWRDLAILNSMEYNESTSKYKCIACNKHQINNVKRRVIEHYRTKNHKENIATRK